ncbi:MAG: helix-turn-helix domain-containing protein [Lentisphaerae bacterium]|nr:MAG: helix-turn-helix domain-containing protein [Lentisphaerota bacterium]
MFPFHFRLIQKYTHAQRTRYRTPLFHINLHVRGLRWYRAAGMELRDPGPFLSLIAPGTVLEFEFGADRENWVIQLATDHVRPAACAREVVVVHENREVLVPAFLELEQAVLVHWLQRFMAMRESFLDPHPLNRLTLDLGVAEILAFMIREHGQTSHADSAASLLKQRIDHDMEFRFSIKALCRECGYSDDHLRRLFQQVYAISPGEYRRRKRLSRVLDLMGNSRFTLKEIAARTGFRHVSHLSALFRRQFGIPPSQAMRHLRLSNRQRRL